MKFSFASLFILVFIGILIFGCSSGGSTTGGGGASDDDTNPNYWDDDVADDDTNANDNDDDETNDDVVDDDADDDADDDDTTDDDNVTIQFVTITHGTFTMGSPVSEAGRVDDECDETQHEVTLTRDYKMMVNEVTQSQFKELMDYNPALFSACGGNCPVEWVTWFDALAFSIRLSEADGINPCYSLSNIICWDLNPGTTDDYCINQGIYSADITLNGVDTVYDCEGYRLPTEAEWEYAARAGTTTAYYSGDADANHMACETPFHLTDIAWYCGDTTHTTHHVGQKGANAWGLYDMLGNVEEWVYDDPLPYGSAPVTDPVLISSGIWKVGRGGDWNLRAEFCRSAFRYERLPDEHDQYIGFRLVKTEQ